MDPASPAGKPLRGPLGRVTRMPSARTLGLMEHPAWPPLDASPNLRRTRLAPNHPDLAESLNNLGVLLKKLGRREEAVEAYRRALEIFEQTLSADHPKLNAVRENLKKLQSR